ncbi:MAG: branched-chain amino acid ABC transporter permease [Candidatus Entotheonella factor]|uniref:Branched-chain amino acid ABC transporter permease n=2 Tax=Candidatus Entotheonella TaxID=93171 RepID=W4L7D0_ENTF1|nr:MAG: branched-chain amino acid ABC transporter permease [Candidatus Entotheonella factor]
MIGHTASMRVAVLHGAVLIVLFLLQFILPAYHHGILTRIMVLAAYAIGYNILFGYTGLLSLGHAMFFAAGLYGAGLPVYHLQWPIPLAFASGVGSGVVLAAIVGFLALRTVGVAFMIVTMMFAQAFYLLTLFYAGYTRGDEGFVLTQTMRQMAFGEWTLSLAEPGVRYNAALLLFGLCLMACLGLVRSSMGRVLIAIRENEERTTMLGYNTFANKWTALVISAAMCAAAGAAYGLLFGYVGSTFASIHYSISPLLWVLLGGAATTLGPLLGALCMFYLVDISSGYTTAYLLFVGLILVLLIVWFPKGILGTLRERRFKWLP